MCTLTIMPAAWTPTFLHYRAEEDQVRGGFAVGYRVPILQDKQLSLRAPPPPTPFFLFGGLQPANVTVAAATVCIVQSAEIMQLACRVEVTWGGFDPENCGGFGPSAEAGCSTFVYPSSADSATVAAVLAYCNSWTVGSSVPCYPSESGHRVELERPDEEEAASRRHRLAFGLVTSVVALSCLVSALALLVTFMALSFSERARIKCVFVGCVFGGCRFVGCCCCGLLLLWVAFIVGCCYCCCCNRCCVVAATRDRCCCYAWTRRRRRMTRSSPHPGHQPDHVFVIH